MHSNLKRIDNLVDLDSDGTPILILILLNFED